jgi:hypothetical protein
MNSSEPNIYVSARHSSFNRRVFLDKVRYVYFMIWIPPLGFHILRKCNDYLLRVEAPEAEGESRVQMTLFAIAEE